MSPHICIYIYIYRIDKKVQIIILIKIMLHKTVDDTDAQSVSTKVPQSKAASFLSTSKRTMYRNKTLPNSNTNVKKVQMQINNVIVLQPQYMSYLVCSDVHFLDNGQNFVVLTDFYYGLYNDRAQPVMIPRNCQPASQLLFSSAKKPGVNINFESLHKFGNNEHPSMLHINLTKYSPSQEKVVEYRDVYVAYENNLQPLYFTTTQNSKKGLIISKIPQLLNQPPTYQLLYISLSKSNKAKNPQHPSMQKQNSFSFVLQQDEKQKSGEQKEQKQFIYHKPETITQRITLKKDEKIIKMINSQFGDSILVATNLDIYQLEFQPGSIYFKTLDFGAKLKKYLKVEFEDTIVDIAYIVDGLTVFFLTAHGYVGYIEAQNIQYAENVSSILAAANKKQESAFKNMYTLVGKIALLSQKGSVVLLKVGQSQMLFEKKIELPIRSTQVIEYKLNFIHRHDELVLQRISKQTKLTLQLLSKNLLSPNNEFSPMYTSTIQTPTQKQVQAPKIITSKSNSISCILKESSIQFYRTSTSVQSSSFSTSASNPIQHLFTKTFYEKPLYISMDPYSSNLCILFKEFVKFYKFKFHDIVQYYTYNVRGVCYAGYTDNGQYVLVAVDDLLYFINAFTFQTDRVIEAYGDIKSVRFFDSTLYLLLKNKINKNTSEILTMQTYIYRDNDYTQIHELKIEPTQAVQTLAKFAIVASNKKIQVYRKRQQIYDQVVKDSIFIGPEVQVVSHRKIKLSETGEYPTCLTLCEEFGVLFLGTNFGRVYEYLWPFSGENDGEQFYAVHCSTSEISRIVSSANLQKIYIYCKNSLIIQMDIIQYVQGEQMSSIYIINPKTLYESQQLKYQFANREYLYPKHTAYIYDDIRQTNQNIEELKFILEKTKDDIDEHIMKTNEENQQKMKTINMRKEKDVKQIKYGFNQDQKKFSQDINDIGEQLTLAQTRFKEKMQEETNSYKSKLLELYAEASRLRGVYADVEKKQIKERDIYLIENTEALQKVRKQGQQMQEQYRKKYAEIKQNTDVFFGLEKEEVTQRLDEQFQGYNLALRQAVEQEHRSQQQRKQSLLGIRGSLMKQILNYRQRKDEFQSLIMETNMQIEELHSDKEAYQQKRNYLKNQLKKKQMLIEEKERELVMLIDSSSMMKKLKDTHEFQLEEYEKQFQPINSKMSIIEGKVQKMNSQILREYLNKVEKDKQIIHNDEKYKKLKKTMQAKIQRKLDTDRRVTILLAQLELLLEKPFDENLQQNLNIISRGQKFVIDEEQVRQKIENSKLMRRKKFIGKQIEEHEKREQQVIRNQNQINRHYNENTMLVRQFNNLKQLNRKLQQMLKQTEIKFHAAKSSRLQTPRKKINSMVELKKISQKKLTPFQKHELEYNDMFSKGMTSETKLTRSGQSMSLLKTLIRDVEITDSKYEKMELVRDRIKSFVNPEIRIRKTLVTQRALFDKKKGQFV